jgi:hypothetical protein
MKPIFPAAGPFYFNPFELGNLVHERLGKGARTCRMNLTSKLHRARATNDQTEEKTKRCRASG